MEEILEYIKQHLNTEQFPAAIWDSTSSLILAGAGSGKTRTLTYKIAYLIYHQHINSQQILAVTFTNKAANEMKERLKHIANDINMNYNFKHQYLNYYRLGTFHGIFLKILKEDIIQLNLNYNSNFGIYDESESLSVLKDILTQDKLADMYNLKELKRKISSIKNLGTTRQQFAREVTTVETEIEAKIYEKYQKKLQLANALDFDDLLLLPYILFKLQPEILEKWKNKFKYILVDEAQDTNQLQFDLIKQLSGPTGNVTFIGDDYQSIYGWRGAVMDNFLNINRWWPNIQIFKLETNYRSRPFIVQAGNAVIQENKKQYSKNIKPFRTGEDQIKLFTFNNEQDEAEQIVNLIHKLHEEKKYSWNNFCVLYRTNAQSQPFEQYLLSHSIPYKIWGGFKFFDRKEIKDIISYLKYIINKKNSVALKRIINIPRRKLGNTTISKLEELAIEKNLALGEIIENIDKIILKLTPSAQNSLKQFNTIIKYISSQISNNNPAQIINNLINSLKYKEYLLQNETIEETDDRMGNIGQLINIATKYTEIGEITLRRFLDEMTLMSEMDMEEKTEVVKLMTIHASKGLEFSTIFVTGLEEDIFPLSKARFDPKELEEERRLMYVAITRAKDNLFLTYANSRQQWGTFKYNAPSRFLKEIPTNLIKEYNLSNNEEVSNKSSFDEGDLVKHKIFGEGKILEIWDKNCIVRFNNSQFGVRKVELKVLIKS